MQDTSTRFASEKDIEDVRLARLANGTMPRTMKYRLRFVDQKIEDEFIASHRQDSVAVSRWAFLIGLILGLVMMWQDSEISPVGYRATNLRIYLLAPVCLLFWYAVGIPGAKRYIEPITTAFGLIYTAILCAILLVFEPGFYGLSGAVAEGNFVLVLLATFTLSYLRLVWAAMLGISVLIMYMVATFLWTDADVTLFLGGHYANAVMAFVLGSVTCGMFEFMRRRQFLTLRDLNSEKDRYKELLYTLVPAKIAHRIEGGEFPIADSQAEVAVLFSDLVGFTELTKQMAPRNLVELLNDLFFEFDLAAERYGVEKIKTIGDGYMAVCGPPVDEAMRTICVVQLAVEMVAITQRMAVKMHLPLNIRVGVHSGNLVAGVIGKSRFTYDMWGDSVNMASRMESSGVPGRVQVSAQAYQRLQGRFEVEPRGEIDVKGIGSVTAYLLCEPVPVAQTA
jgi:adenylate cyclase